MTLDAAQDAHAPTPHNVRPYLSRVSGDTTSKRRHTRVFHCPICSGHVELPQRRGVRCAGFTLDAVSYCTRPEYAGALPLEIGTSPPAYKHRLFGFCDCGSQHGWGAVNARASSGSYIERERPTARPFEEHDAIYAYALELLELRAEAERDLTGRGLTREDAHALGYRSIPRKGLEATAFIEKMNDQFGESRLRACPGFTDKNGRLTFWSAVAGRDGYVVPYRDENGRVTGIQLKVLGGKYVNPARMQIREAYHVAGVPRPGADLWLTESATKANVSHALASLIMFAIPGQALAPEHVATIEQLQPGRVIVALDQEANVNTDRARTRQCEMLRASGLTVCRSVWEGAEVGGPKGLDDLIASGGRPRIRSVAVVPSEISKRRTPRATAEPGPIDGGASLEAVRAQASSAIGEFISEAKRRAGAALVVSTPPGSGKTTAAADALSRSGVHGRIAVGTVRLAREVADKFAYKLIEGRNGGNCERMDVVEALTTDGHDVEELACGTLRKPRCPVRERCLYYQQFEHVGTRVAAAEQLFNPHFLAGGGIVIADDAELSRSLIERVRLSPDVLTRAYDLLRGRRRAPAREVLNIVRHAVVDAPARNLFGAAVWDHLARIACRYGSDFSMLIERLPAEPTLPTPGEDVQVLSASDVEKAPPASVLRLLRALRKELPAFRSGEDFNSQIRVDAHGVDVWTMREPAKGRHGEPLLVGKPLLLLEATPVPALTDHLTRAHRRLPDMEGTAALPAGVAVVQHASAPNGHMALQDPERLNAVLCEVAAERDFYPVSASEKEAAACFVQNRQAVTELGFDPRQVLTFGSARGSNAVANVERFHVIGRPMPPSDDLVFLAQVLHHDEAVVSGQLVLNGRPYGGQRFEVDIIDFEDSRVSALLKASRDDEMLQVIHRARPLVMREQREFFAGGRQRVRLVLHTGHPVPGLRVDQLHLTSDRRDVNEERRRDAERRVVTAVEEMEARRQPMSVNAIAKLAAADKRTVTKVLGKPVDTLRDLSNKGIHRVPQTDEPPNPPQEPEAAPIPDGECAGGCGRALPVGHRQCSECAAAVAMEWGERNRRRGVA